LICENVVPFVYLLFFVAQVRSHPDKRTSVVYTNIGIAIPFERIRIPVRKIVHCGERNIGVVYKTKGKSVMMRIVQELKKRGGPWKSAQLPGTTVFLT
jgi:hypothetical protein